MHTYPSSEFATRPLVVVNTGARASFVDLGKLRVAIAAGEEKDFAVRPGEAYLIGLGAGVRLAEHC